MSLTELIEGVENHEKTLTVYNAAEAATAVLREQLRDRNLTVRGEWTPSGTPARFVVLSEGETFVTAASLDDVLGGAAGDGTDFDFEVADYGPILDHLDETMFTSYDTGQMVAASREIEDRAWRLGKGSLHAGFQRLSILKEQLPIYDQLADHDGLRVHAYAFPDAEMPEHNPGLTIHLERAEEIKRSWFVVYDGAGIDVNKCALLAEEREPRSFYGFWTYDPDTVDWIIDHLKGSYGIVEPA